MIRDQTIDGYSDLPAMMMGDFNVDENHPIMNNIFGEKGAVDAYCAVNKQACERNENGLWMDGQTTLECDAELFQKFNPEKDCSNPNVHSKRLDYVYVKQEGEGWRFVPTDVHVIRDWTYEGPNQELQGLDLSDHYPVIAEFDVKEESSDPDDPDEDDPDDTGGSGSSGCWVNTLKPRK